MSEWELDAACRGMDTDIFYPEQGQNILSMQARDTCARCPVNRECLIAGLAFEEEFGIWGGASPRDRAKIRKADDPYKAMEDHLYRLDFRKCNQCGKWKAHEDFPFRRGQCRACRDAGPQVVPRPKRKLTPEQRQEIRNWAERGIEHRLIARDYGISINTVRYIIRRTA